MNPTKYNDFCAKVECGRRLLESNHRPALAADYDAFLRWFEEQSKWTADTARIGSLMVYGWMPTMLCPEKEDFQRFAEFLNSGVEHEIAKPFVNASWVGTSKFLHFWRPKQWAIWDSRVCLALGWGSLPNNRKKFFDYQDLCRRFTHENKGRSLREVEQCLHLLGKKMADEKNRNGKT